MVTTSAEGGDLTPVVFGAAGSFSPSGRRITYSTGNAIRTIRADDTKPRRMVTSGRRGSTLYGAQFSPKGKRIAFSVKPRGKRQGGIWSVRRDGSGLRSLTSRPSDRWPDYSPDGRHIVFRRSGGGGEIAVIRKDGSHERRVPGTRFGSTPAYAPNGKRIVVSIAPDSVSSCSDLYTMSPRGRDKQRITHYCNSFGGGGSAGFPSWQPLPEGS